MRALAVALLLFLFAAPAAADDAGEVQAVITRQLDAFAADDAVAAFAFAAPAIREKFADPQVFLAMVKAAYPAVYRHRSAQFGAQARQGDRIVQSVTFVDADNLVWTGVYRLERQAEGGWRIAGCVVARADETSL
ncbi:MAG: DUF4864 domain-containing protein [Pseudomonadota bacterium]|nr:DUF4864 domain-containing protein [Pseudomonadota bacterium]